MKSLQHYINGRFVNPCADAGRFAVINPATEERIAEILMGSAADADIAVRAARAAFAAYSMTTVAERIALMQRLEAAYKRRYSEMASAITAEMGAPHDLSFNSQAECGPGHIGATIKAAQELDWEVPSGPRGRVVREPVGVCVLITPWNWPMNQIAAKVPPALLAGCPVGLDPREPAPPAGHCFAGIRAKGG